MRIACLFGVLAAISLSAVSGQNVRELIIYTPYTTIQNFHLEEGETLQIIYEVDPYSLTFYSSTIFRIPTGTFSRDTLYSFDAYAAAISEISASDFINAVSLESLYLSGNPITTIPDNVFVNAPRLRYLYLANCDITTIGANAFAGLDDLESLVMYSNDIVTLPANVFASLSSLNYLDLGSNQLANFNFGNFSNTQLETLWLEFNQFSSISAGSLVSPTLSSLYLYYNQITDVENDAFSQLPDLLYLQLMSNALTNIEEYAFRGLSRLQSLNLYGNGLTDLPPSIFVPLRSLTYMDLGRNEISEISFRHFSEQQYVQTLWIESNNLTSLDIRKLVSMRSLNSLYVYSNDITSLNLNDVGFILPELRYIGVGDNEFYCGEVAQILTNLREFNIFNTMSFDYGNEKVLLDGIGCYEYEPIEPIQRQRNVNKRVMQENDPLFKLKAAVPSKMDLHGYSMPANLDVKK